jgi:hypothetical protein
MVVTATNTYESGASKARAINGSRFLKNAEVGSLSGTLKLYVSSRTLFSRWNGNEKCREVSSVYQGIFRKPGSGVAALRHDRVRRRMKLEAGKKLERLLASSWLRFLNSRGMAA